MAHHFQRIAHKTLQKLTYRLRVRCWGQFFINWDQRGAKNWRRHHITSRSLQKLGFSVLFQSPIQQPRISLKEYRSHPETEVGDRVGAKRDREKAAKIHSSTKTHKAERTKHTSGKIKTTFRRLPYSCIAPSARMPTNDVKSVNVRRILFYAAMCLVEIISSNTFSITKKDERGPVHTHAFLFE